MEKKPFVTLAQAEEIAKTYPTPFYLYDEKGIRENVKRLKQAFAWNKGYKEYFAVKATPNPFILKILQEYGCGTDCSSLTELMMSKACGFSGSDVMFSSNDTPPEEFAYANEMGGIINLDDANLILNAANYNKIVSAARDTICDLDGSGTINLDDLNIILNAANYNKSASNNCTVSYTAP